MPSHSSDPQPSTDSKAGTDKDAVSGAGWPHKPRDPEVMLHIFVPTLGLLPEGKVLV